MTLPQFCIKRPVFTLVLSLLLIVVGVIGYMRIPVRGYPKINSAVITVDTTYPGVSASVIESTITSPIENDLVGINGLQQMSSKSYPGESWVVLHFNLGVNMDTAYNEVQHKLAPLSYQLPRQVKPPLIHKRNPNSLQTLVLSLTDAHLSKMALTDYASRHILPQLEQLLGVARVQLYNARYYTMRVQLKPQKMAAYGVTVSDLDRVLTAQNVSVPSGQFKIGMRDYSIVAKGGLHSAAAFRNLIVREQNGDYLRFGDIAHVSVAPAPITSGLNVNGKPALGIGIYAQATANPIKVAHRVAHALNAIRHNLPLGMKVNVIWNDTSYLNAALHNVYHDIYFAIILVALVVFLFLGSWRSTLIPIITIPICLIGVFALMYVLGYSINLFTLLALVLAIGLVVDDAIVMLENIYRYIETGLSPFKAAMKGSKQIAFAVVAMTLTLAAVYAPIGFATGMIGVVFREFAFTLALAVILSGFVALTLTPMLSSRWLRQAGGKGSKPCERRGVVVRGASDPGMEKSEEGRSLSLRRASPWRCKLGLRGKGSMMSKLTAAYRSTLLVVLRWRWLVVILLIALMGFGYAVYRDSHTELAPRQDMGAMLVSITPPANSSYRYMDYYAKKVGNMISAMPQVSHTVMNIGQTWAFAFVQLKPWSTRHVKAQTLIAKLNREAQNIPGVQVAAFNLNQLGGGGKYGNSVRVAIMTNDSYLQLHQEAKRLIRELNRYPGIHNAVQDLNLNSRHYVIHIDRNLLAAMHVSMASVTNTLQTMLGGANVTNFKWDNREYGVLLQVPEKALRNHQILNQLYVRNFSDNMIPLSSLVSLQTEVGPSMLPHRNRMRADTLTMQIKPGYTMGEVVHYLQRHLKSLLPSGYQYRFKGGARRMLKSHHVLVGVFSLALIFIYLVLAAQFESFIDPFIILLTVPLSIVGALVTLKLTGHALSIYAAIGLVTLVGLIAKHGILITEFSNQLRREGQSKTDALVEAASLRLRPILMTTAAMVLGAVPLAFAAGAGALSRAQIGWVIIGGMTFGTLFSLFIVPVAYSLLSRKKT